MGLEAGLKLGQKVITAWTKTGTSNSLLAMRPVKVDIEGLKLASKLKCDSAEFYSRLSKEEISALRIYQNDDYFYEINTRMREGILKNDEIGNVIKSIKNAISRFTTSKIHTVYRGEDFQFLRSQLPKEIIIKMKNALLKNDKETIKDLLPLLKEKTLVQNSFMSTSMNSNAKFGGQVQWILHVPKGKNAIYLDHNLGFKEGESELLLSECSKIKIVDAKLIDNKGYKFIQIIANII